jgi:SAM-dependent methyltransferase
VRMGYPYPFDELTIIDLPDEERHELYQVGKEQKDVESPLGMVRHRYHSMVDLSDYADNSVDLVYSGQSIEHVSLDEGDKVLAEVYRVLRPGGHFALDTPNARVTRQQQAEFIDPDHEHEYTYEELREKLERAGFNILEAKGLSYAGPPRPGQTFTLETATGHPGLFAEARDCYIIAFLCSK